MWSGGRSASDRTARLNYCVTSASQCCPSSSGTATKCTCDVSLNVTVDVSCQPIVNVDVSYQPVITVDVSCTAVVPSNLEVSYDTTSGFTDAFSRLRVSNPYTLFEFTSILDRNPLLIDELSGGSAGAKITHSNDSYFQMDVSNNGDFVIRQSHDYVIYQPGKSKLVLLTGVLSKEPNVTSRIGTFDASMGIFVESSGGIVSVVKRVGGVDFPVPRGSWTDPLNGTGASAVDISFDKAQIFMFDMEWLGVGQVRCAMVQGGAIYYYYSFTHANTLIAPYIPMAKLPVRYEIRSTGGKGSMRMIAGTVISEGGFSPLGRDYSFGSYTAAESYLIPTGGTFYPILALRLRSDNERYRRVTIKIKRVDIFDLTNNTWGAWKLLLNPTITNAGAWNKVDEARGSAVEYMDISYSVSGGNRQPTTNATGGFALYSDYYLTRINSVLATSTDELVAAFPITTGLNGTSDTVVLVANNITSGGGGGNSCNLLSYIRWIEFV
jgi:hypothetical protein